MSCDNNNCEHVGCVMQREREAKYDVLRRCAQCLKYVTFLNYPGVCFSCAGAHDTVVELKEKVFLLEEELEIKIAANETLQRMVQRYKEQLQKATKCTCDMLYVCPNHK